MLRIRFEFGPDSRGFRRMCDLVLGRLVLGFGLGQMRAGVRKLLFGRNQVFERGVVVALFIGELGLEERAVAFFDLATDTDGVGAEGFILEGAEAMKGGKWLILLDALLNLIFVGIV